MMLNEAQEDVIRDGVNFYFRNKHKLTPVDMISIASTIYIRSLMDGYSSEMDWEDYKQGFLSVLNNHLDMEHAGGFRE